MELSMNRCREAYFNFVQSLNKGVIFDAYIR